jgi:hypothetical protein
MTRKTAYYALAFVLLMGGMGGAALADSEGEGVYGVTHYSFSSEPEVVLEQSYAGEIREPMETGALPVGSMEESGGWLNIDVTEQNSSPELRGRPNIQAGA